MSRRDVDLLVHGAAQVVSCASPAGARRGATMGEVGVIVDGAVAIEAGRIEAVGSTSELASRYEPRATIDARGKVVCPGFVDPHTHVVYAGDRVDEFERRIRGETYQQIMAGGGGIASTVRATRAASAVEIADQSRRRLDQMLRLGTTTAEVKTGYGLDTATEIKLLGVLDMLAGAQPVSLVPTFMPAHAVPDEYRGRVDAYVELVNDEMLPAALEWKRGSGAFASQQMFVDVFCEQNAFDLAQSRRVLEAARARRLPLKAHVDEFTQLGGLPMALELGAISVDHLDVTDASGIGLLARTSSVAVIIPTVSFNLGAARFANARAMIDAGTIVALTTDINPGSSPCPSMPLAMAIACRYQRLSPAEALIAATINAAHAVGLGHKVGSLEPGKDADLLIVDAPDYRHLAYQFGGNPVSAVVKRGTIVQ